MLSVLEVDGLADLTERDGLPHVDLLFTQLGSLTRDRCGNDELAARFGSDEFALGLLEDAHDHVLRDVERVRDGFRPASGGGTLSVGIAESLALSGKRGLSLDEAAEDALWEAKRQGPEGLSAYGRSY